MVGHVNVNQVQQAKLDASLDYDVLIVGAGQVGRPQHLNTSCANVLSEWHVLITSDAPTWFENKGI